MCLFFTYLPLLLVTYKFTAIDALVLKQFPIVLNKYLAPRLDNFYHIRLNGGITRAIGHVKDSLAENKFV
jgi:hypothetical protein